MSFEAVLKEIKVYEGEIEVLTGLHIGAGDVEMHIGGTDNPVVKHPFTHEPYIPGSSLKGKVRSLLEIWSGLLPLNKDPERPLTSSVLKRVGNDEKKRNIAEGILRLFGVSGADEKKDLGPTRASFSDCMLSEESRERFQKGEIVLTEVKAENTINRITGTADHPRFTERVPAGVKFDFRIMLKLFEGDEKFDLEGLLLRGLKLLEYDALGGSGSRGYGRVRITFKDKGLREKFSEINPFAAG